MSDLKKLQIGHSEEWRIRRQKEDDVQKPFSCGDDDLDDFFRNDALDYMGEKLSISYVLEDDNGLLAYFSIANDRVSVEDFTNSTTYNRFRRRFSNTKRLRGYPAVKLCRLGVSNLLKRNGLGSRIIQFLKASFHNHQRSACRFLIVDAYRQSLDFYLKNGFIPFNKEDDIQRQTVPLYFDLADLDI